MAHHRTVAVLLLGGALDAAAEDPDQVAGEVLQGGEAAPAAVVRRARPGGHRADPAERLVEQLVGGRGEVPVPHRLPRGGAFVLVVEQGEVDPATDDAVLEVVHGVGDVVGEVHHLRLHAASRAVDAATHPVEDRAVVVVHPELLAAGRAARRRTPAPGVLGAGIEGRPGEVQADRAAVGIRGLGLQPGQDPQRLGVALETAAAGPQLVERHLAVVAEGWVAHVVGQRGGLGQVGVAAERVREVAGDLGDLEAVGEPVAHEVVGLRTEHLGLRGQSSQGRRVHDPGPVALERGALRRVDPLGRLVDETLDGRPRRTARPRSRARRYHADRSLDVDRTTPTGHLRSTGGRRLTARRTGTGIQ